MPKNHHEIFIEQSERIKDLQYDREMQRKRERLCFCAFTATLVLATCLAAWL